MKVDTTTSFVGEHSTPPPGRWRAIRDVIGAVVGAVLGIAPHVLHHIGLLAGAALVTGASGNAIFFTVGLVLSIPMLRRLYRHVSSWWAPALAVLAFAALFSLSALVIGPAISGTNDTPAPSSPSDPSSSPTHDHNH